MSEFEPSRYLTQLQGKDYLEVKWRLVWLRTEHPDAIITTGLERYDANEAVVHAHIVIPGGGQASGLGSETKQDFRDYLEKAETKAIGRALAALGFGTQFCEDHTFDPNQSGKVVDSPVGFGASRDTSAFVGRQNASEAASRPVQGNGYDDAPKAIKPGNEGLPASEKQIGYLESLAAERGVDLHDWCPTNTGAAFSELTREGASYAIESIKKLPRN